MEKEQIIAEIPYSDDKDLNEKIENLKRTMHRYQVNREEKLIEILRKEK